MSEAMKESNEPQPPAAGPGKRMYIWLGLLVLVGGLAALTFPAQAKLDAATAAVAKVDDNGADEPPVAFMKAIGQTPMVKMIDDKLVQVYRWGGGIKTYEMRIKFSPLDSSKPGIFMGGPEITTTSKPFFMAASLEGFEMAKENTGSTFAELPKLKVANPLSQSGRGGSPEDLKGGGKAPSRPRLSFRPPAPPRELNLTEEQKAKWVSATGKMTEGSKKIFDGSTPRSELTKRMRELDAVFLEDLQSFLSAEQLEKYAEIKARRPPSVGGTRDPLAGKGGNRPGGGRPGGGRPAGGSRAFAPPAELGLTEDQKAKWTVATEKMRGQFAGLREVPQAERAAKFQELRDEFQKELAKFLSPEQVKKYEEIRRQRTPKGKSKSKGKDGAGFKK